MVNDDILRDLEDTLLRVFGHIELDVTVKVKEPYFENNKFCQLIEDRFEKTQNKFSILMPNVDIKNIRFNSYTIPGILTVKLEKLKDE